MKKFICLAAFIVAMFIVCFTTSCMSEKTNSVKENLTPTVDVVTVSAVTVATEEDFDGNGKIKYQSLDGIGYTVIIKTSNVSDKCWVYYDDIISSQFCSRDSEKQEVVLKYVKSVEFNGYNYITVTHWINGDESGTYGNFMYQIDSIRIIKN